MNKPDNGRPILSIKRKPKNLLNISPEIERDEPAKPVQRKKRKSASFKRWQKKRHQRYRRNTCLTELNRLWPALFDADNMRPLATGIHAALLKDWLIRFPEGKSQEQRASFLRQALGYYTHRPPYLMALAASDAQRYLLNGEVAEPVSASHQLSARCRLLNGLLRYPEKVCLLCAILNVPSEAITDAHFSGMNGDEISDVYFKMVIKL